MKFSFKGERVSLTCWRRILRSFDRDISLSCFDFYIRRFEFVSNGSFEELREDGISFTKSILLSGFRFSIILIRLYFLYINKEFFFE